MLCVEQLISIPDLTDEQRVLQKLCQGPSGEPHSAHRSAIRVKPDLMAHSGCSEFIGECSGGAQFHVAPEDEPYRLSFCLFDHQFPVLQTIAKGHRSSHPNAFALRCGYLVADALARDLALKLSK